MALVLIITFKICNGLIIKWSQLSRNKLNWRHFFIISLGWFLVSSLIISVNPTKFHYPYILYIYWSRGLVIRPNFLQLRPIFKSSMLRFDPSIIIYIYIHIDVSISMTHIQTFSLRCWAAITFAAIVFLIIIYNAIHMSRSEGWIKDHYSLCSRAPFVVISLHINEIQTYLMK